MAKLKAHGQEIARLVKDLPDSDYFIDNKHYVALFSDNWILDKHTGRHKPDQYSSTGQAHTWGWKRKSKLKEGVDKSRWIELYVKRGYKVLLGE